MERLWNQMKKLRLSDKTLSRSEGKAGMLEQQPAMTEKKMRRLEEEKQAAGSRAGASYSEVRRPVQVRDI